MEHMNFLPSRSYAGPAYEEIFAAVKRLLSEKPYVTAAIDGRCGSGKTTLARELAQHFQGRIIHTDDFYLPPEMRRAGWEKTAGANMDFERLRLEAVQPAAQGREIVYRPYRCQGAQAKEQNRPETGNILPFAPLTVVEGTYSLYPPLADCYDLKIFLTCPQQVQRERLVRREGEHYADFEKRWIPLEEQYFREYRIREKCDIAADTGSSEVNF